MKSLINAGLALAFSAPLPALAATYDLVIDRTDVQIEGQTRRVFSSTARSPARRCAGRRAKRDVNVINRLTEETSSIGTASWCRRAWTVSR